MTFNQRLMSYLIGTKTRHQTTQTLVMEIYKIFHGLSTSNYKELFIFRNNNYNTRSKYDLTNPLVNSVLKGRNW